MPYLVTLTLLKKRNIETILLEWTPLNANEVRTNGALVVELFISINTYAPRTLLVSSSLSHKHILFALQVNNLK